MSDLRSKLQASGTLVVQRRGEKTLPVDVSLKVLRFATTQDLGRLGRAGTAWRDLSLRELTRLPGDWEVRRMGAPDHRVYFRSVLHERAQWEKFIANEAPCEPPFEQFKRPTFTRLS